MSQNEFEDAGQYIAKISEQGQDTKHIILLLILLFIVFLIGFYLGQENQETYPMNSEELDFITIELDSCEQKLKDFADSCSQILERELTQCWEACEVG